MRRSKVSRVRWVFVIDIIDYEHNGVKWFVSSPKLRIRSESAPCSMRKYWSKPVTFAPESSYLAGLFFRYGEQRQNAYRASGALCKLSSGLRLKWLPLQEGFPDGRHFRANKYRYRG